MEEVMDDLTIYETENNCRKNGRRVHFDRIEKRRE